MDQQLPLLQAGSDVKMQHMLEGQQQTVQGSQVAYLVIHKVNQQPLRPLNLFSAEPPPLLQEAANRPEHRLAESSVEAGL